MRQVTVLVNPQGRVPSLVLDDGTVLTQSPAILEFLEEVSQHQRFSLPIQSCGRRFEPSRQSSAVISIHCTTSDH